MFITNFTISLEGLSPIFVLCGFSFYPIAMSLKSYLLGCFLSLGFIACKTNYPNQPALTAKSDLTHSPVAQLYPYLNSGSFHENKIKESPDPLVNYRWDSLDSTLQVYNLRPVALEENVKGAFQNINSGLSSNCAIEVTQPASLRIDFGVVSAAWLEFDSPDFNGEVRLSISEYNEPAIVNAGPEHPSKTAKPVRYNNTYRLELNKALYEGVRFGWIHVDKVDKPWHITNIRLVCQTKPVNYEGSFACSDPTLTKIWYTGAYTVKLNILQDYFGAILMDRGDRHSWTGDAHTSQAAALVAFSNYDMIRKNIERTSDNYNGIESYSLYWILSLIDYVNYTGDVELLDNMETSVTKKIEHASKLYGSKIRLGFYGWDERLGAGFETSDCEENQQAYRMLFIQTCNSLNELYKWAGKKDRATYYEKLALTKLNEARLTNNWTTKLGLHAGADAINSGLLNNTETTALLANYSKRENNVSFSPFNQFFIIKSMAKLGLYNEAFTSINDSWGGQLQLGATTFWECFRPQWTQVIAPLSSVPNGQCGYTSLCHPWSSGITKWLSEEVLGIKPTTPGFKEFVVQPHLTNELTWVSGSVMTINGLIKAEYDRKKGKAQLVIPEGSIGSFALPKQKGTIGEVKVNGTTVWKGGSIRASHTGSLRNEIDYLYLENLKPGNYSISFTSTSTIEKAKPIASSNLIKASANPSEPSRIKNAKGYVLFNQFGKGKHEQNLPAFIDSVGWKHSGLGSPGNVVWTAPTIAEKGAFITSNPNACMQTFYVDVFSKTDQRYSFSLIMNTNDKKDRKFIAEIFDLETKNLMANPLLVKNPDGTTTYTYSSNRPVRVRISHVEGENSVLSGIIFN